jgi:hypothetical protein
MHYEAIDAMQSEQIVSVAGRGTRVLAWMLLVAGLLLAAAPLRAQSNFAFWVGGTQLSYHNGPSSWGTSVGATGKFNITPIFLLRGQFNVDRVQFQNAGLPEYDGTQTMTFIGLGTGPEIAVGWGDVDLLAHVTLHGDIRSVSRILDDNGAERVWKLTRFSMGVLAGAGFEAYITDNIGFETQAQYDIFNFDATPIDPHWYGLRISAGVQFYLGRNFIR